MTEAGPLTCVQAKVKACPPGSEADPVTVTVLVGSWIDLFGPALTTGVSATMMVTVEFVVLIPSLALNCKT